jgi:flagellar biosynthetic protein FliP
MTTIPRPPVRAALTNRGFVVHYVQMLLAMGTGLLVLGPLSMLAGDSGVEVQALLMATWVSAGMAAWMAWKRHTRRSIVEMCLAMYLSFAVLFPLRWLGPLAGDGMLLAGNVLMLPAMALVMLRRREE